jgi:carboxyl-terminal processing protease
MGEVTGRMRGAPGSTVRVGFRRGEEVFEVELERARIKVDSVLGVRLLDEEHGVGYLRVSSFQENTGEDARAALAQLEEEGARSIVLDLRQNRGGVLEKGAVALVDLFLAEGRIVETRGRAPDSRKFYSATADATVCPTAPLVVLVDGGSASAAEVVAGALQDHRRGFLVGERTYGKFLVQSIHRLPDLDVAVALTTARYYTPYGRWLQRRDDEQIRGGLLPDVVVPRSREETEALVKRVFPSHHGVDMVVAEDPVRDPDPQLDRAVKLLADYDRLRTGR